ncbi:methyl-accepting chemotaxis protein [Bacillus sp. HMF5848]|uniref:methyl-accepting chemotaxis protein n=1 Tax=Bacillus sp. HMF5848 TaxID=2495421 RepID=UPI000F78AF12|nr:methyl-accepting chemotaxis protein [Bacillus sp. HMF5848]RSK25732.1 methyl-accepting chemotaxis protein [Bacillus sp. HMF5848]
MKSIKAKLLLAFTSIILLTVILGSYNFYATTKVTQETKDMVYEQLPLLIAEEQLVFNIAHRISLLRGYILDGDLLYKAQYEQYTESGITIQERMLTHSDNEEAKILVAKTNELNTVIKEKVLKLYDEGSKDKARRVLSDEVQPIAQDIISGYEMLAAHSEGNITAEGQSILKAEESLKNIGGIISILSILVGGIIATIMARVITNPIVQVSQRMKSMSEGDLSQDEIKIKGKDEISQLARAANDMQASLKDMMRQVLEASNMVSTRSVEFSRSANEVREGSEQIASTMQELSSGAETQANSSSQLMDAMESLVQRIKEAYETGDSVSQTSQSISAKASEGSKLMDKSIDQMNTINEIVKDAVHKVRRLDEQSQDISKLVKVIQDIAEQTNLLSLNAAIEAARAGEHGKGFAVVANEVRKLAEQVSTSVVDITNIVNGIQHESNAVVHSLESGYEQVEQGSKQIETTGYTFSTINEAVSDMAMSMQRISTSLQEIVENSAEMKKNIEEVASVSEESAAGIEQATASTQQSSSSMEEVARSAEELSEVANQLQNQVNRFKLN